MVWMQNQSQSPCVAPRNGPPASHFLFCLLPMVWPHLLSICPNHAPDFSRWGWGTHCSYFWGMLCLGPPVAACNLSSELRINVSSSETPLTPLPSIRILAPLLPHLENHSSFPLQESVTIKFSKVTTNTISRYPPLGKRRAGFLGASSHSLFTNLLIQTTQYIK